MVTAVTSVLANIPVRAAVAMTGEITLRGEVLKIEKDLPPVDVMFLYDVINKIGELSDRAEQVGHRISLIASR